MWIARNLKRCMSIYDIKRKLTNEYRPLIAQWELVDRNRYAVCRRHYMRMLVAKSRHRYFWQYFVLWKKVLEASYSDFVYALTMRWHAMIILWRIYFVIYHCDIWWPERINQEERERSRVLCPVNAKKDSSLVQLLANSHRYPYKCPSPILVSLIRITKLRWFATHMCPNLMAVLPWKLLNIVIDILLIR